jgi:hypothetical protein
VGEFQYPFPLENTGHADRPTHHRKVFRSDEHLTAINPTIAHDDAICSGVDPLHFRSLALVGRQHAQFRKRIFIEQQRDPFTGSELSLGVLARDLLRSAHCQRLYSAVPYFIDFRLPGHTWLSPLFFARNHVFLSRLKTMFKGVVVPGQCKIFRSSFL